MGILRTTITTFSVVTSGRITSMDQYMTKEEMIRDMLVDRLHELVNQGMLSEACALYEEYRDVLFNNPEVMTA